MIAGCERKPIDELTQRDAELDGFASLDALRAEIARTYPGQVTVWLVRWMDLVPAASARDVSSHLVRRGVMVHGSDMAEPNLSDVMAKLAMMELKLEQQSALLIFLTIGQKLMSTEVDNLATQVTANTSVEQSAQTLIQGISAQIQDAAGDRTKSLALAATLKASADALSAAVAANTPAATTPAA